MSTEQNLDLEVYARVENRRIVEYPVYGLHITNRAHPFEWYQKVIFDQKPETPDFYYLQEVPVLQINNEVHVTYTPVAMTLRDLLTIIYPQTIAADNQEIEAVDISTVDEKLVNRIVELVRQHVQKMLDEFAQQRGYDGIVSAVSYANSSVQQFANEGQRALQKRDETWTNMYAYIAEVKAGSKPVPKTVSEIEAELPVLTWE